MIFAGFRALFRFRAMLMRCEMLMALFYLMRWSALFSFITAFKMERNYDAVRLARLIFRLQRFRYFTLLLLVPMIALRPRLAAFNTLPPEAID